MKVVIDKGKFLVYGVDMGDVVEMRVIDNYKRLSTSSNSPITNFLISKELEITVDISRNKTVLHFIEMMETANLKINYDFNLFNLIKFRFPYNNVKIYISGTSKNRLTPA